VGPRRLNGWYLHHPFGSEIPGEDRIILGSRGRSGRQLGSTHLPPAGDEKEARVHDQFDVTLEDSDLLGEVELTTNLIIAASESEEHLSVEEIDRILDVTPRRD
jgi:hypothetical protein